MQWALCVVAINHVDHHQQSTQTNLTIFFSLSLAVFSFHVRRLPIVSHPSRANVQRLFIPFARECFVCGFFSLKWFSPTAQDVYAGSVEMKKNVRNSRCLICREWERVEHSNFLPFFSALFFSVCNSSSPRTSCTSSSSCQMTREWAARSWISYRYIYLFCNIISQRTERTPKNSTAREFLEWKLYISTFILRLYTFHTSIVWFLLLFGIFSHFAYIYCFVFNVCWYIFPIPFLSFIYTCTHTPAIYAAPTRAHGSREHTKDIFAQPNILFTNINSWDISVLGHSIVLNFFLLQRIDNRIRLKVDEISS